jgi:hypothetical protein
LFGALRARLDCFVAKGERSDAVLSNGYASQTALLRRPSRLQARRFA